MTDWSRVNVPLLSAGNWGGQGLHLRGGPRGFELAASAAKWLEMHDGTHWSPFYAQYGLDLQKRFLGYFLKGNIPAGRGNPACNCGLATSMVTPNSGPPRICLFPTRRGPACTLTQTTVPCDRMSPPSKRRRVTRAGKVGSVSFMLARKILRSRGRWRRSCTWKAPQPTRTYSLWCEPSRRMAQRLSTRAPSIRTLR